MQPVQRPTLGDLYSHFSEQQLQEAEANLERYLSVMLRIAERLRSEGYDLTSPDLTRLPTRANVPDTKVDSHQNN